MPLKIITSNSTDELSRLFAEWEKERIAEFKSQYDRMKFANPNMPPPSLMIGSMNLSETPGHWEKFEGRDHYVKPEYIIIFTHN